MIIIYNSRYERSTINPRNILSACRIACDFELWKKMTERNEIPLLLSLPRESEWNAPNRTHAESPRSTWRDLALSLTCPRRCLQAGAIATHMHARVCVHTCLRRVARSLGGCSFNVRGRPPTHSTLIPSTTSVDASRPVQRHLKFRFKIAPPQNKGEARCTKCQLDLVGEMTKQKEKK